jgi:hypothetical protein
MSSRDPARVALSALPALAARCSPSCDVVRVIGLGIGPLSSETSLGQAQFLLYLADAVRAMRVSPHVECMFFDPAVSQTDRSALESAGVVCETKNLYGAYTIADNFRMVQIAFMPHCPLTLYRNMLACNWPLFPQSESRRRHEKEEQRGDSSSPAITPESPQSFAIRRLMILGNDFSAYNITPADAVKCPVSRILPILEVIPLTNSCEQRGDEIGMRDLFCIMLRHSVENEELQSICGRNTRRFRVLTEGPDIL